MSYTILVVPTRDVSKIEDAGVKAEELLEVNHLEDAEYLTLIKDVIATINASPYTDENKDRMLESKFIISAHVLSEYYSDEYSQLLRDAVNRWADANL